MAETKRQLKQALRFQMSLLRLNAMAESARPPKVIEAKAGSRRRARAERRAAG